ncbi:DoxX family membrane protein [Streptomyces sp. TLI_171]|uniref:DoxX family membrane protein n=1 Tax=Streptomyces sp. TLI_171 TaxID=1938859 RepID=UPI000C1A4EC0|nr:DoxX family membrane protein [Streptomyces sp. TLI_171]RKE19787.1 putative membrane protein YphA (DoxX/SURF4 family) [Streptomyces sp. TLI_171]
MDTRTPLSLGQRPAGIDDGPGLNTVRVPSDPAKLSSTQASFRVRLSAPVAPLIDAPAGAAFGDPYGLHSGVRPLVTPQVVVPAAAVPALAGITAASVTGAAPRRKPRVVTWSGQAGPGDTAATQLLEAVRLNTVPAPAKGYAEDDTQQLQAVPRQYGPGGGSAGSGSVGSGETPHVGVPDLLDESVRVGGRSWQPEGELPEVSSLAEGSKHAWYPGRRVDLGLVLLPLRVLLGSLSVYAGFSKLCDPVYFDGGERGSMMRWLSSLHPWKAAQPLLDFAMAHPVGAGLAVSFAEIVIGVLTLLGLWQRLAAGAAMLLSAALLFTVSWKAVPVYDTPDLIFLAAWSPLLIAGAPFASLDGRIALEAFRRHGPAAPGAVRRRMLRRRTVVTAVVVGLTLLSGSLLGAAVRTGRQTPVEPAPNYGTPVFPAGGPSSTPSPAAPSPTPSPSKAPASPSPSPSRSGSSPKAKPSGSPSQSPRSNSGGGAGTGGSTGGGGSAGGTGTGGAAPTTPRSQPSHGVIGGLLGSGPPLLELGMSPGSAPSGA